LPAQFDRIVQSWDTASKATELSDFSVCTSWGIVGKELYLLDVLRRRMEYPELKRAVRDQHALRRPSVVLIEDKASGTQLIQELVADGSTPSPATSRVKTRSCACTRRRQ
jgi:predicted phage terminase large subunit-like protein